MDQMTPFSLLSRKEAATPPGAWTFSTDEAPRGERRRAWVEAMRRLRLPVPRAPERDDFEGAISCLTSPLGMDFAVMSASPHEISGRNPDQPAAVWLVLLLEGAGTFWDGRTLTRLEIGDIVYGPTGVHAALTLETSFRLLFINMPRVALNHRLIAPMTLGVGRIPGGSGLGHVFSGLLRGAAESLDHLTSEHLRPVELAATEFLVANLADQGSPAASGAAGSARAAHLHRICQTIETLLSTPDLTLADVAEKDGVSPRYLQKLFASANLSFSSYLRTRRLERCRIELTSPIYAGQSISQICFNWGFNGSAHFSRAFKEQFGVSPREYRRSVSSPKA